jgi:hypothetical protein
MSGRLTRRQFMNGLGGVALGLTALSAGAPRANAESPEAAGADAAASGFPVGARPAPGDPVAAAYYRYLLLHTRWAQQQWDAAAGHYAAEYFNFAVVLGNAVLLNHGDYDAEAAGVDAATLKSQTLATIRHFAASNVLTGGEEWGETMFFDSTFELYFVLAAKLLWADLDAATRAAVDALAAGQAAYTTALGTADDPRSPGWSPNGLNGNWQGDTKVDEMAVYAQCLGPAVAWLPEHADAATWAHGLDTWLLNDTGLPAADRANPAVVAGRPISDWNTAHNVFDTFLVENHGSFEPHYQLETWRMSARVATQFLAAGRDREMPRALWAKPNGVQLWRTVKQVLSSSGEPFMPMNADRYHLFGRDVLPLAFMAQVLGDREAARAEADMAAQLGPYQLYPPQYQLTKFSGEAKYEPEARAELAISYLFHVWRARQPQRSVPPVSGEELFAAAAGTTDYGELPGLVAHNSPKAFAATVSKPSYVKFVFAPNHDDWLFDLGGASASLLPSTAAKVAGRFAAAYSELRDGYDATASLLTLTGGYAGLATLPTGAVVYATSGNGAGEGVLNVFNLAMPGIPGLGGTRTYSGAGGTFTVSADEAGTGGTDDLAFPAAVSARYVRVLGIRPATKYGYSIYSFGVFAPGGDTDLARGRATTASSWDPAHPPAAATDGDATTRWAVAVAARGTAGSWLQVDLGSAVPVERVTIAWEAAYGAAFAVQTSLDGTVWSDAVTVPKTHRVDGGWLNVDGRAGFVVRGSSNPITVTPTSVVLSDGPASGAAGMVVEGYPAQSGADTAARAALPVPTGAPAGLAASLVDGCLSLFNLTGQDIGEDRAPVRITLPSPGPEASTLLYRGRQTASGTSGIVLEVVLAAATARVEAPRFRLEGAVPAGLVAEVADSRHLRLTAPADQGCRLTVTALAGDGTGGTAGTAGTSGIGGTGGNRRTVALRTGQTRELAFDGAVTPTADLALGRTTFPTSPLPDGMSDPAHAVDGAPDTAWLPGAPDGRMVVDLGAAVPLRTVATRWSAGRTAAFTVSVSSDGATYTQIAASSSGRPEQHLTLPPGTTGRYLALAVSGWNHGDAGLAALTATS